MRHLVTAILPLALMAAVGPAVTNACRKNSIVQCIHRTFIEDPDVACRARLCFQDCSEVDVLAIGDPWLETFFYGLEVLRELELCPAEEELPVLRKRLPGAARGSGISSRGGIPLYRVWYKQPVQYKTKDGVLVP